MPLLPVEPFVITFLIRTCQAIRQVVLKLPVSSTNLARATARRAGSSVNDPVVSASCPQSGILCNTRFVVFSCRLFEARRLHVLPISPWKLNVCGNLLVVRCREKDFFDESPLSPLPAPGATQRRVSLSKTSQGGPELWTHCTHLCNGSLLFRSDPITMKISAPGIKIG